MVFHSIYGDTFTRKQMLGFQIVVPRHLKEYFWSGRVGELQIVVINLAIVFMGAICILNGILSDILSYYFSS